MPQKNKPEMIYHDALGTVPFDMVRISVELDLVVPKASFDNITKDRHEVLLKKAKHEWSSKLGDLTLYNVTIENL